MRAEHVDSPNDPRLDDYRVLKEGDLLRRRGVFIAEGRLVVERLLEPSCRFGVKSALATPRALEALAPALERCGRDAPVFVMPKEQMEAVMGFAFHRGVVAAGLVGDALTVEEAAGRALAAGGERTMLVALEDLVDTDNVGSIFRSAAALGAGGVVLSPRCADPLYRKAIRTSMGHALRIPFARARAWPDELRRLRELGFVIAAMTPGEGSVDIGEFARTAGDRVAVLVGAEGDGLSGAALAAADARVRIPMSPGADSLNVATACAIALQRIGEGRDRLASKR